MKPTTKTATKKPAKKAPTLDEVKAVVRAWLAANHPEVEHATLSSHNRYGSGPDLAELLGPPTDKAWFTNDLPPTEAQEAEREAAIDASVAKFAKRRKHEEKILQEADNIDPQRKVIVWVARWANATSMLNALDNEFQDLSAAAKRHELLSSLGVDRQLVVGIAAAVSEVATDSLTMPFSGRLPLLAAKGGA